VLIVDNVLQQNRPPSNCPQFDMKPHFNGILNVKMQKNCYNW